MEEEKGGWNGGDDGRNRGKTWGKILDSQLV
jgi:hypothetical protein